MTPFLVILSCLAWSIAVPLAWGRPRPLTGEVRKILSDHFGGGR